MKYLIILLLVVMTTTLQAQEQKEPKYSLEASGVLATSFTTGRLMLGANLDVVRKKKYVFESSIISHMNDHYPTMVQEKLGVHVNHWTMLAGGSYHYFNDNFTPQQSEWKFVTEIKYSVYLFKKSLGLTLQHDGNYVALGVEIGAIL